MSPAERRRRLLGRAYWNVRLFGMPPLVRDLWLIIITALLVVALVGQQDLLNAQQGQIARNRAIAKESCDIRRAQRRTLEQQWSNTVLYMRSPAGHERNALNDFIRRISVPQLRERLRTETVPRACE